MSSPGYDYLIDLLSNICKQIKKSLTEDNLSLGILKNSGIFASYKVEQTLNQKSKTFVLSLFDNHQQQYNFTFHSANLLTAHNFIISVEPFKEESTTQNLEKLKKGNDMLNDIQELYLLCLKVKHKQLEYFSR